MRTGAVGRMSNRRPASEAWGMRALGLAAVMFLCSIGDAHAQNRPSQNDRSLIESCLREARTERRGEETCIGTVQGRCIKEPGGDTTTGMQRCGGRELAVWDERLNAAYRAALASDVGKQTTLRGRWARRLTGADIIRDAQRAWLRFRSRKCDAAGLPMEGGTGAGLLTLDCHLHETARQAIWLERLVGGEQ
ncbi:lysozyme inhibitor LprI family protein [Enterovirga aerilata]|uniref:DUF1311 domain-containing protein n=1 Tax=Enterovirga aerilata TaxID=2730920 RepID=A0A849I920_9HYPH|nr:lysozyme inhibitor LprI family protein [Enterovirga sp. DB1703]NNM72909.1 DUF1311 domain-containing protein [Enterovirga sp. DB1703]